MHLPATGIHRSGIQLAPFGDGVPIPSFSDQHDIFRLGDELPGLQISRHEPPETEGSSPLAMEAVQIPGVAQLPDAP
jgi:hypothetical protein